MGPLRLNDINLADKFKAGYNSKQSDLQLPAITQNEEGQAKDPNAHLFE